MGKRLMVTGSRHWEDEEAIYQALLKAVLEEGFTDLQVGDAPGADELAWTIWGSFQERFPNLNLTRFRHEAHWNRYGRAAGPERNGRIIKTDPDLCLAFLFPGSRGTKNAIDQAKRKNISVVIIHGG